MICHENDKPYSYKYVNVLRDNFEFAQKQAKAKALKQEKCTNTSKSKCTNTNSIDRRILMW